MRTLRHTFPIEVPVRAQHGSVVERVMWHVMFEGTTGGALLKLPCLVDLDRVKRLTDGIVV
jgi:hypothetical protein